MKYNNELLIRVNSIIASQLNGDKVDILPALSSDELQTLPADQVLLYNNFRELQNQLRQTGQFVLDLSNGKLNATVPKSNSINAPLKALHASLRHLRWQMQQMAMGDYNQKTDFLGEFSKEFNGLAQALKNKQQIQTELRERDAKLKLITDNISDVIWIVDTNLKLTYISPSVFKLRGYTAAEVMSQSINQWMVRDSIKSAKVEIKRIANLISTGKHFENFIFKVEQPCKDGTSVWTEVLVGPVYNDSGILIGCSGVSRDITARRQAELALSESEQKFRILSQTTSSGIYVYQDSKFYMVNPAFEAIMEYSAEELKHLGVKDLVHHEFVELVSKRAQQRMDGKTPQNRYEIKVITKTGKIKWLDLSSGFISFLGKPAILGTIFDITHQKQIQSELELSLLTKNKFFSIIGHDLIGPIGSINQLLDMVTDKNFNLNPEEKEKSLGLLKVSAANVFTLLENLLNWSLTQSGTFPFNPGSFNLNKLIIDSIDLFKSSASNKNIDIVYHNTKLVDVWFDFDMMNAMIRNLLNNALKFSFYGGTITIETGIENNNLNISIRDEGVGMGPEVMEHLFTLDRNQKSTSGTEGETGTGLGLILCAEFAKKHGGCIGVNSKPGRGSIFTIKLPLAP